MSDKAFEYALYASAIGFGVIGGVLELSRQLAGEAYKAWVSRP